MNFRQLIFTVLSGVLLLSCSGDPLDVDISNVSLEVRYTHLDSLISNSNPATIVKQLTEQRERTGTIMDYQLIYCWSVGRETDSAFLERLHEFRSDLYVQRLEKRIGEKFRDLPSRHRKIVEGLKHLHVHLPKARLPKEIVYLNSYFAGSAFCSENEIAIGLERYLGATTDVIRELPEQEFFPWIKQKMDAGYLERDAVAAWIMTNIVEEKEQVVLIEDIIRWGKIIYLTEAAFPDKPQAWILRYTEKDLDWAMKHERAFWDYLVEQKMLFAKDENTNANLLNDAPFTAGLPEKGPDRLGQFLGWRIIHSYMEQYDVTLQELINMPYTELLQEYEITD